MPSLCTSKNIYKSKRPKSIFIFFTERFVSGHAKAIVDYTPSPYDRDALRFKKDDIIDIIREGGRPSNKYGGHPCTSANRFDGGGGGHTWPVMSALHFLTRVAGKTCKKRQKGRERALQRDRLLYMWVENVKGEKGVDFILPEG